MKVTILGTGTSCGVPQLGCSCAVCTSSDPRDSRLRCSALVEIENPDKETGVTRILIDCGPDFRQQMLRNGFKKLDAIFISHEHYDHVGGIDDIRPFSVFGDMTIYADQFCAAHLKERIPYCFTPKEIRYPGVPRIDLEVAEPGKYVSIDGIDILPIRVYHGKLPILAYRIGTFAYVTDMKTIELEQEAMLRGVEVLVVNGLRHTDHPTHQTVEEAVAFADKLNVKEAYIIHFSHEIGLHAYEEKKMPPHRYLAYDGLVFDV